MSDTMLAAVYHGPDDLRVEFVNGFAMVRETHVPESLAKAAGRIKPLSRRRAAGPRRAVVSPKEGFLFTDHSVAAPKRRAPGGNRAKGFVFSPIQLNLRPVTRAGDPPLGFQGDLTR